MGFLRVLAAGFILASVACSGEVPNLPSPRGAGAAVGRQIESSTARFAMLHSFSWNLDGARPGSDLTAVNGVLYGTTTEGGTSTSKCSCGTVFSIDSSGQEKVLYRFVGGKDGAYPEGGLTYERGAFFGTTAAGGGAYVCPSPGNTIGCGTIFAVDPSGHERVVYRFMGGADGRAPLGDMVALNGKLYGVTTNGGGTNCNQGCGTVFSKDSAGHVAIVYRFKSVNDGSYPMAGLSLIRGTLYGTTSASWPCKRLSGCGNVFTVTESGRETVVHRFLEQDGAFPESTLLEEGGRIYGTTRYGGNGCVLNGCGTIYSMDPSGANERVLWLFGIDSDGQNPLGRIAFKDGKIYGVTQQGGNLNCGLPNGCGTIFAYSLSNKIEAPIHRFLGGDGTWPLGGVTASNDAYYGTAYEGGHLGGGTIFRIEP